MAKEFKLPEIGENIDKVSVAKIHIKPGDTIKPEQTIMELEAAKAVVELPSSVTGKVLQLKVSEDQEVAIGETLFTYED